MALHSLCVEPVTPQAVWSAVWSPDDGHVDPEFAYLLVDHAGAPGLVGELGRLGLPWRSLFEGSREAQALSVAPILVALGPCAANAPTRAASLLAWLQRQCAHACAVLCMRSSLPDSALHRHLIQRLDATLPGGLQVLLRYFDSRTFESLAQVMTADQLASFLGVARRWAWMDRAGGWCVRAAIPMSEAQLPAWQWSLTPAQEALLVAAAEPDSVMLLMRRVAADLCGQMGPAELHRLVSNGLVVAKRFGIEDVRQQALFCLAEIEHGPAFHEQARWQAALDAHPAGGPMNFETVIQLWENTSTGS